MRGPTENHSGMFVQRRGQGPTVVFVHGGADSAGAAFYTQLPLAQRWRLVLPDRPGYGRTPSVGREDFARDADLIAGLLADEGGGHLVGHSYGGLISLLVAAAHPALVRSLTIIEPPAYSVARGQPPVDEMERANRELFAALPADPAERVRRFHALVGTDRPVPDPLPASMQRLATVFENVRGPWEAEVPLDQLASCGVPALVVTSGKTPGFEVIADVLACRLAAQHIVFSDADHAVQRSSHFNEYLETFLESAQGAISA